MIVDMSVVEKALDWAWAIVLIAFGWIYKTDGNLRETKRAVVELEKKTATSGDNATSIARLEGKVDGISDAIKDIRSRMPK